MDLEKLAKQLRNMGFRNVEFVGGTRPVGVRGERAVLYTADGDDQPIIVANDDMQVRLEPWDYPRSTMQVRGNR